MKSLALILLFVVLAIGASSPSDLPNFAVAVTAFQADLAKMSRQELLTKYFEKRVMSIGHQCGSPDDTSFMEIDNPADSSRFEFVDFPNLSLARFRQMKSGDFEMVFFPSDSSFKDQRLWFKFDKNQYWFENQARFIGMGGSLFLYCILKNHQIRFTRAVMNGC